MHSAVRFRFNVQNVSTACSGVPFFFIVFLFFRWQGGCVAICCVAVNKKGVLAQTRCENNFLRRVLRSDEKNEKRRFWAVKNLLTGMVLGAAAGLILAEIPAVKDFLNKGKKEVKKMTK